MSQAQPYKVWLVASDGTTLDISDGVNYLSDVHGLHNLPAREALASQGYQSGSSFYGERLLPRQFSITIHIVAGDNLSPIRNASHNAARDALIRFLPSGELIRLRTQYLGSAASWDIEVFVGPLDWQEDSISYTAPLQAFDPRLTYIFQKQIDPYPITLPSNGSDTVSFTATPGGNVPAHPIVQLTPTAAKDTGQDYWHYMREYTITNPSNVDLVAYPVSVPFDFAGAIAASKCRGDGGDIRVFANDNTQDRWLAMASGMPGQIWVSLDLPPSSSSTVRVIYGYLSVTPWVNSTDGPMFDLVLSNNTSWVYNGAFMDSQGLPSSRARQWNVHSKSALGYVPLDHHLTGSPWIERLGEGWTGAVNAAGAYVPGAYSVQGYCGMALHHPLKISSVAHKGYVWYDPALTKLTLRTYDDRNGQLTDVWEMGSAIPSQLMGYAGTDGFPLVQTFSSPVAAVVFALRSLSVHTVPADPPTIAGADYVEAHFPLASVPTVTEGPEVSLYYLDCELRNLTTGDVVRLQGVIIRVGGVWQTVEIDFEDRTVVMAGEPFYYALDIGPVREDWFKLKPGVANQIEVSDVAVSGLEIRMFWYDRRL